MKETLLVIDDSLVTTEILKAALGGQLSYNVISAADGETGLSMAIEYAPDLVMLDMNLPSMSGLQTLELMRAAHCAAPVIFMTGYGSEKIAVEAFRMGVRDYLTKPFSVQQIRTAVDGALREARLAREKEELERNLIASKAVQQTAVTLSHYINNYLQVLTSGLHLLKGEIEEVPESETELNVLTDECIVSTERIRIVMSVLRQVTQVSEAVYQGKTTMIDIDALLHDAMEKIASP